MSDEKIRREFNEWFSNHIVIGFKCEEDAAWAAWQASRAAIEVELPESASIHNTEVIKAVGRYIVKQGLKVKP